jgi:sulfur relay (sulfurtransferase) DsrC/TusE family protein
MPLTEKYSGKVHAAYEATQAKDGMNKKNLKKLQKLLKYYPESKDLEIDGFYGTGTIEAVNSFYENYYWTPERRMQGVKDKYGEKYIMQSELEAMQEAKPDSGY